MLRKVVVTCFISVYSIFKGQREVQFREIRFCLLPQNSLGCELLENTIGIIVRHWDPHHGSLPDLVHYMDAVFWLKVKENLGVFRTCQIWTLRYRRRLDCAKFVLHPIESSSIITSSPQKGEGLLSPLVCNNNGLARDLG